MADRFTIRMARSEDASALRDIEALSFPDPWTEADFMQLLSAPGTGGWVCCAGQRLCGYILVRSVGEEAEILNLAVSPEFRRQRVARRLLGFGLETLLGRGVHDVFLEVRRSNRAARALYDRLGFTLAGVRRGYYRKPLEDAMVLRCRLDSSGENDPLEGETG
jgi:ribosomal-protein-alanine N-acetyltransferase